MFILKSIKFYVDKILFFLLSLVIFAMLLCVSLQVFSRYVMKSPFVFTEELVRFLLIWLGLLGGSYSFGVKGHIALTLFFDKFNDTIKFIAKIIIDIAIFLLSLFILIIGGLKLISITQSGIFRFGYTYVVGLYRVSNKRYNNRILSNILYFIGNI